MQRTTRRRWALSIGILAGAVALVWLVSGSIAAYLVESRLRGAGFANASAAGASFGLGGVDIERLRLTADDAFVLDDVHVSLSTSGITGVGVGALRLQTELDAAGDIALPGFEAAAGDGPPADIGAMLPDQGIRIARATVSLATPSGRLRAALADVAVDRDPSGGATASAEYALEHDAATIAGSASATLARGGALEAALTITRGSIEAGGLHAEGLTGSAQASLAGAAAPVAALELAVMDARVADFALGRIAFEGSLREGSAEFGMTSPASDAVDLAVEGRASLSAGVRLDRLTGRAAFKAPASGALTFELSDLSLGDEAASGRLEVSGRGLAFPGLLSEGSIDALARVEGNGELLSIEAEDVWTAGLVPGAELVPGPLEALAGQRLAVTISARDRSPLGLRVSWSGRSAALEAALEMSAGQAQAVAAAELEVSWAEAWSVAANALTLDAEALPWDDLLLGLDAFEGQAAYDALQWRIAGSGTARAEGSVAGVNLTGAPLRWSELELRGPVGPDAGTTLSAALTGGALTLTSERIGLESIDATVELRRGALQSSSLTVAAVESLAEPAWWMPMSLEAGAERDEDALAFEALISDDLGVFVLEATGRSEDGRGTAELVLYPIRFLSGATEIGDVSPLLAERLTEATGTLAFNGMLDWDAEGVESSGLFELDDFGATVAGIPIAGVRTKTALSSLWPPATAPEQTAEIARISLGVPLVDGLAVYDLDAGGRLAIHRLAFEAAGGRIYTEPFTADSVTEGDIRFTLRIEDLELAQMLELSQIDGLEGTGALSGSIPVVIADGEVRLDQGRLAAETDGSLRYTPDSLPAFLRGDDQRARMLREVLTNFQYDDLSVTVSGESGEGGRQTVRFDAAGANPDFLDGHPIELAFTFQGPLLGAMSSAVSVAGAAEIEDMFEQQLNNTEDTQ